MVLVLLLESLKVYSGFSFWGGVLLLNVSFFRSPGKDGYRAVRNKQEKVCVNNLCFI